MSNYDSSQVGVPYIRVNNIAVQYNTNHLPVVTIQQMLAVKLADGSFVEIGPAPVPSFTFTIDLIDNGNTAIPLIDPTTGASLGANTTANQTMLAILAAIRAQQLVINT